MSELKFLNPDLYPEGFRPHTEGSFGYDLRANIPEPEYLYPEQILVLPTGVAIHTQGPAALVLSRSGLAAKGVFVVNAPGLIDYDYQGEIKVILSNIKTDRFLINPGDRIAQLVFTTLHTPSFKVVNHFSYKTLRGVDGLGSTGTT
jgi:dUTP pyrophosphatase